MPLWVLKALRVCTRICHAWFHPLLWLDADPVFCGGPPSRWFNQTGVKGVVELEVGQRALHAHLEQWVLLQSAQGSNSVGVWAELSG